jgi:hypothetical protein
MKRNKKKEVVMDIATSLSGGSPNTTVVISVREKTIGKISDRNNHKRK